jgi:Ras-related protein Rab-1A
MSDQKDYDYRFKFVIIGDSGVGKSNILLRFADDNFMESHMSTIGVDFRFRTINVDGKIVKIQLWDTAGQERFKAITNAYYKGADGIIICYDITDRSSFEHLESEWISSINSNVTDDRAVRLIIGNKADLHDDRDVTYEEGENFAEKYGYKFIETSAKDGTNVDTAFLALAKDLIKVRTGGVIIDNKKSIKLDGKKQKSKKNKCCDI